MKPFNRLPLVYVASPYSCKDPNAAQAVREGVEKARYHKVTKAIGELQDIHKCAFIAPITQSHNTALHMDSKTGKFACWRDIDLTYISKCDELWVITLDGWDESVGVLAEIDYAMMIGIPVYLIVPDSLRKTILDPNWNHLLQHLLQAKEK